MATLAGTITQAFKNKFAREVLLKMVGVAHAKVDTIVQVRALKDYVDGMRVEVENVDRTYIYDDELTDADDGVGFLKPDDAGSAAGRWRVFCALADGSIVHASLAADAVEGHNILAGTIAAGKLAADAVTEDKITALNVTAGKLDTAAVATANIGPLAVTELKFANDAVDNAAMGADAVIAGKIGLLAVTSAKILNGEVSGDNIGLLAVNATHIQDDAVIEAKLGAAAVEDQHIPALSITSAKLALNSVVTANILDGEVTHPCLDMTIADGGISGAAIETDSILNGAVISGKLATDAVEADNILNACIDSAAIGADAVIDTKIAALVVQHDKLAADCVLRDNITAMNVTHEKLAAGCVATANFGSHVVLHDKLATAVPPVQAGNIGDGEIETAAFADAAVTAPKIKYAVVPVSITVGNTTGVSGADATLIGGTVLGHIPASSTVDQTAYYLSAAIDAGTGVVTVTISGAAPGTHVYNVFVVKAA